MKILRRKGQRRVVLALSDMHAGHKFGLLSPDTVLLKENDWGQVERWQPSLGATQRWLWACYADCIDRAVTLAGDDEIVVLHCGDATNGNHYGGNIPDTTQDDQRVIARHNLTPLAGLPQVAKMRLVTGTEVHVPECAEAKIAADLGQRIGKDVAAAHHSSLSVDGVTFDVAHHGPYPGSRDWLKGNTALYYLRSAVYEARRYGKQAARVYLRGHYHEFVEVPFREIWQDQRYRYDLYVAPSFCGMTSHARKVSRSEPILVIGMIAFVIEDGRLAQVEVFRHWLDLRSEEVL